MQTKTAKQYRASLNHNNTHATITTDDQNELKSAVERLVDSPTDFRTVGDSTQIFQKSEPNVPIGWVTSYSVPEQMSLAGIRRGQLQLEKAA